jgi:enoyl-CoA hydratase/carnithine racemase
MKMKDYKPSHFNWRVDGAVAVIMLTRSERKNPVTFEFYAELRDTSRQLAHADDIGAVVFGSNGGNFCSGGDGVRSGHSVETLYREIRALRIYEGASDVQKIIIARSVLSSAER